jgi:major membrane immunogen (membrane-anchored lipoprotein)
MFAVLRKSLISAFCASVLFAQTGSAFALARAAQSNTTIKKKVVTNVTVTGPTVKCGPGNTVKSLTDNKWGFMAVQIQVTKTVTTVNGKPSVSIKINKVSWPVTPTHTPRSIYINNQALPLLQGETLQLQASVAAKLVNISGATHSTISFRASLQAALVKAETP